MGQKQEHAVVSTNTTGGLHCQGLQPLTNIGCKLGRQLQGTHCTPQHSPANDYVSIIATKHTNTSTT